MKKTLAFLAIIVVVFLSACSEDDITPNERFAAYVDQWNDREFSSMSEMLSAESTESYTNEGFVDRHTKIYEDLDVSELNVTFEELNEEELETAMDGETATLPFSVEMETLAGPVDFDYEATLVQEDHGKEDENLNWYVQWDSGFIFPEMKDGGEISLETENPTRGDILDRNDMPLAMNDTVYEIGIIPEELGQNQEQVIESIADLLHISVDEINSALDAGWVEPHLFVPLTEVLQTDEDLLDNLWATSGVAGREVSGRVYPAGEATGHLIGNIRQVTADDLEEHEPGAYHSTDMIGARGLESLYEDRLKGEKGFKIIVSKEDEDNAVLAEQPVEDGEDISVTIDVNVQEKIYESLNGDAGTSAAIDPESGETLALVNSPSFDSNDFLYNNTQDMWDNLQDDEQSPLTNRFQSTYAPASVIKPVTAAIGLENGSLDPNEGIEIDGLTWGNGEGWGDYEVRRVTESDGPVDLNDALVRSDNIYFAMQAIDMGSEVLVEGLEQFGFEEELSYEYPIEPSSISADGTLNDEVSLANTSYGQAELEMSALHLAATYTTFLNEGNMIKPTLLTSEDTGQIWQEELLTAEHASLIAEDLRDVVTDGTAQQAQEADFPISGKTGTAELKRTSDESGIENSWFVGYPTDEQDILIAMMVEETQGDDGGDAVEKVTNIMMELK